MAKELPIDNRLIAQLAQITVKNLVDGIVELVTNSDDSYKRLEEKGKRTCGEIEIHVSRKKGGICEYLKVKDYAEGMDKDKLEKALLFAGEASGFKEGRSVRGLFGRGLKETIIALGEGEIRTVKNGEIRKTKVWCDEKSQYDDVLLEKIEKTQEPDGTEISIKITSEKKIAEYKNFWLQISNHYALRDINSSPNRKITLFFEDASRKLKHQTPIKFSPPPGTKVFEEILQLPEYGDKIHLVIYESNVELRPPRYDPDALAGILIKTKGAILDNQLFDYDQEPAAHYFFGEAICDGLEERLRRGETGLINPNRGGLEWRHDYCQKLQYVIVNELDKLVVAKKKSLEKGPTKEVVSSTKRLIRDLCNELNRFAKLEFEEVEYGPIDEPEADIENIIIKPDVAYIHEDKPRNFSVYAPADLVNNAGRIVLIKSDNPNIQPLVSQLTLEAHPKYQGKIWYRYFKVVGRRNGEQGVLTATLNAESATAKVIVEPPRKKRKGEKIQIRKYGFISSIEPDEMDNPGQRVNYSDGIIKIYVKFLSVAKFIKSGLEGVETPEGKVLMAELVGDAFCKELARKGIEQGKYPKMPGGEIDSFNAAVNELQKKYLHKIQEIIFAWKFKD